MRVGLTFTVLGLAALLCAAGPAPSGPPPGVPKHVPGMLGPGTDLLDRLKTSPKVARGHVLATSTGQEDVYKVHVDRWLKGDGPADLTVDFGSQRPVTAEHHAELLFLGPTLNRDGGQGKSDLRAVTEPGERYEAPDADTATLDQASLDFLAGAPEDKVLQQLITCTPRFSEPAAARMALRGSQNADALAAAEAAVRAPATNPEARAKLVDLLGGKLTVGTLIELTKPASDVRLRLVALDALGRMAANEPANRPAAVHALEASAADSSPLVQLRVGLALAEAGQSSALTPLNAVLAGSDQTLRAEAVRGLDQLARHGDEQAEDQLAALQSDPNAEVKARATNLTRALGPRPEHKPNMLLFGGVSAAVVVILLIGVMRRRKK